MVVESKTYKTSFKDVYDASIEALKKCGFEVRERKDNAIKATSSVTLLSWGENIEVLFTSENESVRVSVSSVPMLQLFD